MALIDQLIQQADPAQLTALQRAQQTATQAIPAAIAQAIMYQLRAYSGLCHAHGRLALLAELPEAQAEALEGLRAKIADVWQYALDNGLTEQVIPDFPDEADPVVEGGAA